MTKPTDISPYMALNILIRTSQRLKQQQSPVQLSITTIRPGSFKALQDHLENASNNKTYELAHLDLHGDATAADGACLFFEGKRAKKEARGVDEVALLLSRAGGIPFVVINACRSARADLITDSSEHAAATSNNTAAVFLRNGAALHVLAMSFEILSAATELFLDSFYTELFIHGATFSRAAQQGRSALQTHNTRPALFDVRLPLGDWCCPVVYSAAAADDAAVVERTVVMATGTSQVGTTTEDKSISVPCDQSIQVPVGRDFDVGRLEKILLKHGTAFVHGPMGVGKTTFLGYARGIWAETGFADTILSVDFALSWSSSSVCDFRSLVENLWLQLPPTTTNETAGGSRVRSLLQHVKECKTLIIVDGLDSVLTRFPSLASLSPVANVGIIREFLKQLVTTCRASIKGSMIVLAGRHPPPQKSPAAAAGLHTDGLHVPPLAWLYRLLKPKGGGVVMQLQGLSMYDSLILCHDSIRHSQKSETTTPQLPDLSDPGTRDDMELLCRLLLGIPGAISCLVRDSESNGVSWRSLRHQLTTGESKVYDVALDTYAATTFAQFRHLPRVLSPKTFAILLFLGLFWHQGPYDKRLANDLVSAGVSSATEDVQFALEFAADRGYIQLASIQDTNRISFVHPIFTTYARAVLEALSRRFYPRDGSCVKKAKAGGLEESIYSSLGKTMGEATSRPLAIAVRYFVCITSPRVRTEVYTRKQYMERSIWYLNSVDFQLAFQTQVPDEATQQQVTPFKAQINNQANHFLNTLACFDICVDPQRNLDPVDWPCHYFVAMSPLIVQFSTTSEVALFVGRYERLLARFLALAENRLASDTWLEYCYLALVVAFGFVHHRYKGGTDEHDTDEKWVFFAERAMRLCEEEGSNEDYKAIFRLVFGATVAKNKRTSVVAPDSQPGDANTTTCNERFEQDIRWMSGFYEGFGTKDTAELSLFDSFERSLSQTADATRVARDKIPIIPPGLKMAVSPLRAAATDDPNAMVDMLRTLYRPGGGGGNPQEEEKRTNLIVGQFAASGHGDLIRVGARQFAPVIETMARNFNEKGNATEGLVVISDSTKREIVERALRAGDWRYLAQHHAVQYKSSLETGKRRQALGHLTRFVELFKSKNGSKPKETKQLQLMLELSELFDEAEAEASKDKDKALKIVDELESLVMQDDSLALLATADNQDAEAMRSIYLDKVQNLRCLISLRSKLCFSGFSAASETESPSFETFQEESRSALARPGLPLIVTAFDEQRQTMAAAGDPEAQRRWNTAFRLNISISEAMLAGDWKTGQALLDELQTLCREDPAVLTALAGGQKYLTMNDAWLTYLRLLDASMEAAKARDLDEAFARLDELESELGLGGKKKHERDRSMVSDDDGSDSAVAFVASEVQPDLVYRRALLTCLRLGNTIEDAEKAGRPAEALRGLREMQALGREEPRVLTSLQITPEELEECERELESKVQVDDFMTEHLAQIGMVHARWFMVQMVAPFVASHIWLSLLSSGSSTA